MLTSPSGKSYIGQTTRSVEERLKEHQKSRDCIAIYNAIQKYGWENFEKDWYELPDEELNKHEELMVEVLGTLSPDGYNLRDGGGSTGKLSEETKKKIGDANRGEKSYMFGKTLSEEVKQKISDALQGEKNHNYGKTGDKSSMFGKNHTEETKQKISEAQLGHKNHMYGKNGEMHPKYGKILSEETKQKLREINIGKIHSEETKQKMREAHIGENNHNSKKVYQYDLENKYIRSFDSSGEAARYLKKNGSSIRMCAGGDRKSAHGFKWSYEKN